VPVLRVLALVPIARTAQLPLAMLFQAMRRPGTVLALDLLKFGVEFGSYVVLIPWLGLVGAGVANLGSVIISYVVSLIVLARAFPAGAAERARTVIGSMMLFAPLMAAGVMLGRAGTESWTFALRVMLLAVAIPGVFALGLVTPLDLERLAAIPLRTDWMRRTRDAAVNIAGRVASLVAPGGAA
jgi:O-antigen/teichoic acid export membrane protein